jgi:hypothetical protein
MSVPNDECRRTSSILLPREVPLPAHFWHPISRPYSQATTFRRTIPRGPSGCLASSGSE